MSWRPSLGAWLEDGGVRFRVWAPGTQSVHLHLEAPGHSAHPEPVEGRTSSNPQLAVYDLTPEASGYFGIHVAGIGAGARYRYTLDDRGPFPDPCSRFQPDGVHAASEVDDPSRFAWSDAAWPGIELADLVTYELHVGTFTREGTYAAAAEALPALTDLGITAVQLLPLADFPGERGWGYDGVALFAPARCYGTPDDLRGLVDRAHGLGIAVLLDVVYNHFGPDGAYQGAYTSQYFNPAHHTPWGSAINLDGDGSEAVRHYFIESAEHWLHEFHVDGFRLDATHALIDAGPRHFLEEFTSRIHASVEGRRPPIVIVEDHRNERRLLEPIDRGGYGIDAVLADDFHHEVRRLIAGDHEGYYQDYRGDTGDLAADLDRGWLFSGQFAPYWNEPRGTDPEGLVLPHFVHCLQNHDQIGNRPFGDRLSATVTPEAFRAASALLLTSAGTPMLFQGQEWAASSPFQFFTDHNEELGHLVTEGRRSEFQAWSAFRDEATRERIPDPQALATFERSKLDWEERARDPHRGVLALYRRLLGLRRSHPALRWSADATQHATALDADSIALVRRDGDAAALLVCRLRGGPTTLELPTNLEPPTGHVWQVALTTEDADFVAHPAPIEVTPKGSLRCSFQRAGAVLWLATPASDQGA